MKQKETKILVAMIAIILVAGIIMIFTKGLAFELKYQDSKKVEVNSGKEFEEKDIKEITDEIFGKQTVTIQAIEVYKDAVSITTTEITDTAEAHTGAIAIEKVDKADTSVKLEGAKFKVATSKANAEAGTFVKGTDGEDIEVTTDANGLATIKGLAYADDGSDVSYWLVETQAPTYKVTEGGQEVEKTYKLLKTQVEVKVGKTTHNTAVVVQNSKEIDLPATGGIGIAIFAVVGIGIMVISRKMNKEQNIQ